MTDFNSVYRRLLGTTPATQWYKVRLCSIKTEEIAGFCEGDLNINVGYVLLNGRLLHNRWTDFDSVCGGLLGSTPAIQQYKVHLCRIKAQEMAVLSGRDLNTTRLVSEGIIFSMADCSTTD